MEVDSTTFQWQLPRMLRAISTAHFVAIDLEFSGIQSKAIHRLETSEGGTSRKQTLQQRYEEVKEAAERYQILQIGLTCVEEDKEKGVYVSRPYNFYLSPLVEERLGIERIFSFQSGAVDFLLSHGFRIEAPFKTGVPYLSRLEELRVQQIEESRNDKASISPIVINSEDLESADFVKKVREDILNWKSRTTAYPDYLNIAPAGWFVTQSADRGLNRFQKRLVHQLVRAEHPDLVTISKPGFIQIVAYDKKREDKIKQSRMAGFDEKIARQIGLRWLVEGMVGGDLSKVDVVSFARTSQGEPFWMDLREARKDFDQLRAKLTMKRTTLVGHNLFVDLVNFYQCFFGKLPQTVIEFQVVVHQLFPMIVDTKYLATYQGDSSNAWSGLKELDEELQKLTAPVFETHSENSGYHHALANHEAGYDSYITARILVRLSAKLATASRQSANLANTDQNEVPETARSSDKGGVPIRPLQTPVASITTNQNGKRTAKKTKHPIDKRPNHPVFSNPGMFDVLKTDITGDSEDSTSEDSTSEVHSNGFHEQQAPTKITNVPAQQPTMMPAWDAAFWYTYGNKLRVNGTVEGICDLEDSLIG